MPNCKYSSGYWCMLRDNHKLRTLIKFKLDKLDKTNKEVADEIGIAPYRLSKYLNIKRPHITQFELMKLCNYLNIEVTLDIKLV